MDDRPWTVTNNFDMVAPCPTSLSSLAAFVVFLYHIPIKTMAFSQCYWANLGRNIAAQKNAAARLTQIFPGKRTGSPTRSVSRRWMGSRVAPGNPPGDVYIEDSQTDLPVDLDRLRASVSRIRSALGYGTYDLSVFLVDDREMRETNRETRSVDAPTDILSFPFHPSIEPGVLAEPDFDIPDYYNLGDLMVDPAYVMRRCVEDAESEGSVADGDDDRGVSGAMAKVSDPEDRINMLLIHGVLHLIGYDHEEDDEYELMVTAEERLLRELDMIKTED
jgi:probable rRNA maturation factor